tara:strand:+ start:93 stop:233 length:141 start_codon:yes stop_codon:yes gene_type:complete
MTKLYDLEPMMWIPYLITQGIIVVTITSPVWWLLWVLIKYIKGKKK